MKKVFVTSMLVALVAFSLFTQIGAQSAKTDGAIAKRPNVTNVVDYGAIPDDGKDDTKAIRSAIEACRKTRHRSLVFPAGTYRLGSLKFPSALTVSMSVGARWKIQPQGIVEIDARFVAGLHHVFAGDGHAHFGPGSVGAVFPQWWGASPASSDCSPAINRAIRSAPKLAGLTVRLTGQLNCRTTILVDRHRVRLLGDGMYASRLLFDPAKPATLVKFAHRDRSVLVQCAIRDVGLLAAGAYRDRKRTRKVGIQIVDADILEVRNVAIHNWGGNGSVGLQVQGRQLVAVENVTILADLPILIDKNPGLDWISIDHSTFRNTYLLPMDANGPSVKIASGVALHNVVFDGTHAWVGGKYGLYWNDKKSKGVGINLTIKNVRMENAAAHGGAMIHIAHNYGLHNVVLENIYGCGGGAGGVFLRKCSTVTMSNILYTPVRGNAPAGYVPTALDVDESCRNIALINTFWSGGHVKTGKLVKTFGTHSNPSRYNNRIIEVYDPPNNEQGDGIIVYGTRMWTHAGEVGPGQSLSIPIHTGTKLAKVSVTASDGKLLNDSAEFVVTKGRAKKVSGSKTFDVRKADGKLILHAAQPRQKVNLVNRLGKKVEVIVTVFSF